MRNLCLVTGPLSHVLDAQICFFWDLFGVFFGVYFYLFIFLMCKTGVPLLEFLVLIPNIPCVMGISPAALLFPFL